MNRSLPTLLLGVTCALITACAEQARSPVAQESVTSVKPARSAQEVYSRSDNWGNGPGCEASGPERVLRGVIRVAPFGKGTNGARIDDGTKQWVISYRADATLIALDGKSVEARGRPCAKQGEAISGPHFDVQTLTPVD